jgi:branched-chain amino acid transport system substrate-binding protein
MRTRTKAFLIAILAIAITASARAEDKIAKIGILAPLTGGAAADGEETQRSAQLAVEEINAAGGVAGYKLEIVVGDTGDLGPNAVITAFQRLNSDSAINMMMTGYASASNFEIQYMADAGMPYFLAGNSKQTAEIIEKAPDRYTTIWSFAPSYDLYETGVMPVIEKWISDGKLTLPNKKIAFISSDNPYSRSISDGMQADAKKRGWEVTDSEVVPFGEINDWHAFLSKVRQDSPGIIVNTDYLPGNAATFMSQFAENPTNSLVFIQYAPTVPEFLKLTGDKGTGVITSTMVGLLPTKRAAEITKKYHDRYGVDPGTYGEALYEMVYMYRDALAEVKDPTNRLAISAALSKIKDRETALGVITFDPQTHLAIAGDDYMPLHIDQVWKGELKLLSPARWADGQFQMPPWMNK